MLEEMAGAQYATVRKPDHLGIMVRLVDGGLVGSEHGFYGLLVDFLGGCLQELCNLSDLTFNVCAAESHRVFFATLSPLTGT